MSDDRPAESVDETLPVAGASAPASEPENPQDSVYDGEETVARSERGVAANDALRALSRAARSFLLYDPRNEAIRGFLKEYQDCMGRAVRTGTLELEVRPFELTLDGEVVYLERDRERSLAFRLFRDGVRRLTLEPAVEWAELLRLLEILSVRYTGVRQHEDDVVTLLWKAGFKNIDIVAVEGFVPEEDADEAEISNARTKAIRAAGGQVEVPSDFDTPVEPHDDEVAYGYRALTEVEVAPLKAELSSQQLPATAIRLVTEMLRLVGDRTDPTTFDDITALLEEVRLFLLSEGQIDGLLNLARKLHSMRAVNPDAVAQELGRFADLRALRRIVHSAALLSDEAPPELVELLDMVPGEHLRDLVALLGEERSRSGRRMVRRLVQRHVARHQDWLLKEIAKLDGQVAADLLRAVVDAEPALRPDLIDRCIGRTEPEVQREVRRMLGELQPGTLPLRTLHDHLKIAPGEGLRIVLIDRIVHHKDKRSFQYFQQMIDEPPHGSISGEELSALGRSMASIAPDDALTLLGDWVRPRSLWDRMRGVTGNRNRQWAGVAGLGLIPNEEAEVCIRWLSERAGEEMHAHCTKTLFERRRAVAGGRA